VNFHRKLDHRRGCFASSCAQEQAKVGLFFIDFAIALIVTASVNRMKRRRDFGGIA
jgi:hypothetical protein